MTDTNQIFINLNNAAIQEIRKGNLVSAFRMLSHACSAAGKSHTNHVDENDDCHTDDDSSDELYKYSWVDCSRKLLPLFRKHSKFREGSAEFLWLKFLKIEAPKVQNSDDDESDDEDDDNDNHTNGRVCCPCACSWVLWYNLGIISALLGTPTCKAGRMLLDQALRLFDRVSNRLQPEPDSKHWSLLHLAVMNNRACVLKDLAKDDEMLDGLVEIGLACSRAWKQLDIPDCDFFHWVAATHLMGNVAVAA